MEVKVADQGQWEKVLNVSVSYEELVPKFDESYKNYKKSIQLEGFRKGKVPLHLIKNVFGSKIEMEVAENSIKEYLEQAIKENEIKMYDVSKINDVKYDRENGLNFEAVVQIEPEVNLSKYKQLEIEKEIYQLTDHDVEAVLKNIQEQHAIMNTIEDEAQLGHYIVADLQKTDASGIPMIGNKFENRYLQLVDSEEENPITEQLIGVKSGDTRQVKVPVPNPEEEQETEEYYAVTVKEIKEKILPEIDDELAKKVGGYSDLETMKKGITENLEQQYKMNVQQQLNNRIMDEVIKNNPIDLPDYMIENFLDAFVDNMKNEKQEQIDEQEVREKYRADAIWNLKWILFREKIIAEENIEVDDNEVNDYIENMASNAGENVAAIRSNYRQPERLKRVKQDLQEKKILDFLIDNAVVTETTVTYEDRMKQSEFVA